MMRIIGVCVVVGAAVVIAGCGAGGEAAPATSSASASGEVLVEPSPTGPQRMDKQQAAARYLAVVCPFNVVNDQFTAALAPYTSVSLGSPVPDDVRAAAGAYAASATGMAQQLNDPAHPWPIEVAGPISQWAVYTYSRAGWASALAEPGSTWVMYPQPPANDPVSQIRLALGLGPTGTGCTVPSPTA